VRFPLLGSYEPREARGRAQSAGTCRCIQPFPVKQFPRLCEVAETSRRGLSLTRGHMKFSWPLCAHREIALAWEGMHDLKFVRPNLALVEETLRARGQDPAALLGNFAALDAERRELITEAETLKARRNALSEEVGRKKGAKEDATALMEETRQLKEKLEGLDASASATDEQLRGILASIPNLPHASVPAGTSERDNVEQKQWGTK